jgi:hypothetical protein
MANSHNQDVGASGRHSKAFKIGQMVAAGDWSGLIAMAAFAASVCLFMVPLLGAILMIFAGFVTVLRQADRWLRTGSWPPLEFRAAWLAIGGTEPDLPDFRGVQKILVWVLDQPLSVSLIADGVVLIALALVLVSQVDAVRSRWGKRRQPQG